jgi:hypothetical protein
MYVPYLSIFENNPNAFQNFFLRAGAFLTFFR